MTAEQRRLKQAKRRKPAHPLARQRQQRHAPQPNLAGRKRILDYLTDTIGMCEALFDEHGENCECEACCITSNLVGTLRVFRMVLEIS